MSDEIQKAVRDALAAADNTEQLRAIATALQVQQLLNAQQQPAQPQPVKQEFNPMKWLVIGGVVVSVGLVGALFAVAIAIGGACATVCLLVLRSVWRDLQSKG